MGKLRVNGFSISIDGFGAAPGQALEHPMGVGGMALHEWVFPTRSFHQMIGEPGGETGVDEDFATRAKANLGAWILGRNMFGPARGPWPDDGWKGWWGDDPPYHVPVFVLTHHARAPITMQGGTVFHFVTSGIRDALRLATDAAGGRDIRVGGGVATVRQYLEARLIDEMHLVISPIFLGSGENLLAGLDLPAMGFERTEFAHSKAATHVVLSRRK